MSQLVLISGHAILHRAFGGPGPGRRSARERAHLSAMQAMPVRCRAGAGDNGVAHTDDCDVATNFLVDLRVQDAVAAAERREREGT